MKKYICIIALCFHVLASLSGQGLVRGKITDDKGEALIGVSVIKVTNTTAGASTDLNGNYSLKIADSSTQTILVSYLGYTKVEFQVRLKANEILIKDISLQPETKQVNEVVITAKALRSNNGYMEKMKMNSAATLDYVSAETMKKTGDASILSATARVAGVSTNGAGFITVRGIGDRYVKTAINGLRIPTLDPFTNNIRLDMFPANLVDNVIITKTASPDLPGDWAGAYLSVETKDYPEQFIVNVETSFGYNNQSSLKQIVSSQHSSTEWMGFDNGNREYNHTGFVPMVVSPSLYQEFKALGLGPYLNSLGYTSAWASGTGYNQETLLKAGLLDLGLLSKAQFNDPSAIKAAENKYDQGNYHGRAFDLMNADAVKATQRFTNNWYTTTRNAPLDFSQNFSIGNQVSLFGRPLGFLFGFRYVSFVQSDPNSTAQKATVTGGVRNLTYDKIIQQTSRESNGWSGLINLAYKLNPNNSFTFLFMPNVSGVNKAMNGSEEDTRTYGVGNQRIESQFYESRKQMIYQFKSDHFFSGPKMKVDFNASYTRGNSEAPDFKAISLTDNTARQNDIDVGGNRYFRYLKDNIFDSRLSADLPLGTKANLSRKLKFGLAYQRNDRQTDQYNYTILNSTEAGSFILGHESSDPLSDDKFMIKPVISSNGGYLTHSVQKYYSEAHLPLNHSIGFSTLKAAYVLTDFAILPRLRFSGGLRVEQAYIYTDVKMYDSLKYTPDDLRRNAVPPGKLDELSLLPSGGIIYKIQKKEESPMNLRVNFSQTVARPSIRELSGFSMYDYEFRAQVTGNPDLKMVQINNYDLRIEKYFASGDNVSLSLFYKEFKNHIELINMGGDAGYFWLNNENRSWLKGLEIEGKKTLGEHFELSANISLVQSQSKFIKRYRQSDGTYVRGDTVTISMFGQAPYVVNAMFAYNLQKAGFSAAVVYNLQGPRLVLEGYSGIPDVYELPRNVIDLKASKTLGKHFGLNVKVRDLLNAPIRRAYRISGTGSFENYDTYHYGTTYVLTITYKI
jgi:hypothetical protein